MRVLSIAALAALLVATPLALAAPTMAAEPTVRVTGGNISVRSGPGMGYPIVGKLAVNSQVTLDQCTRNSRWCLVNGSGWAEGSYLVGWAAKIKATPQSFLADPFGTNDGHRDRDRGFFGN